MKLSVSSYSYQQAIKAGKMTQLDVVKAAAESGFAGIDFIDLQPDVNKTPTLEEQLEYAKRICAEAEKYGVEIVAYTIGANLYRGSDEDDAQEIERLKGQLDVAAAMGAKILRHDVCYREKLNGKTVSFDAMLPTIAKNARAVTEYAKTLGIRTCTENHGYIAQDSDRVERLYNAVGHENYGLLIDIGNFACVDEDSTLAVSRLSPYALHVHAKDFRVYRFGETIPEGVSTFSTRACNRLAGCTIGEGDIPVRQCVEILKRAGYDGYLTVEYEGSEDCFAGIAKGHKNLQSYL